MPLYRFLLRLLQDQHQKHLHTVSLVREGGRKSVEVFDCVSITAPPPIKQLHGIMKKEELRKQKKQRVRWDKSYRGSKPPASSLTLLLFSFSEHSSTSQQFKTRRADTNVLAVKFNTLQEAGHIHTGEAQFCSNPECGAVVSHLTKLIGEEDDDKKVIMIMSSSP